MTEALRERSVFLLGPTGVGKSALGNELIDPGYEEEEDAFSVSSGMKSETAAISLREKVFSYVSRTVERMGQAVNVEPVKLLLRVGDSPGLSDTEGRSTKFLDDIMSAIKEAKPHGLIIVVQSGKDSHEFQLSLRALAECLGTCIEDTRRVALFVNKLPTDFQFRRQKPPIRSAQKQSEKRLEMVEQVRIRASELLGLKPAFHIRTAIGNTFGTFDGVEVLRDFIAEMPDDAMDISSLRTWSEARAQAEGAVREAEAQARAIERRVLGLQSRVLTLEQNIGYYKQRMGRGYVAVGLGTVVVTAAAHGASLFVPGLNIASVAVGAAAAAGSLVGGKATANVIDRWNLPLALEEAKQEYEAFRAQGHATQVKQEILRLRGMLTDIQELQKKVDSSLKSKL